MKIVILGGSFGGLTVAHILRKSMRGSEHEIAVVSASPRFVFIPSLPDVALGEAEMDDISFDLASNQCCQLVDILLFVTGRQEVNPAEPAMDAPIRESC